MIAINKHSSKLKIWSVEMPNAPYSERYPQAKKRDRMINLLQENKEIESHRTNCTFGFLPTQRQTQKNQKSNFLPTLSQN